MLERGYVATANDLHLHTTGGLKIDRHTGLLPSARNPARMAAENSYLDNESFKPASWIRVRPGLNGGIVFYAVTHTDQGMLIAISDTYQTRFYWLGKTSVRRTAIVNLPSRSFEEAWENLFTGLLATDDLCSVQFYSEASHLVQSYLVQKGRDRTFVVEGKDPFDPKGEGVAITVLEWEHLSPNELKVSCTFDKEKQRTFPFQKHPIHEVRKVSSVITLSKEHLCLSRTHLP